MSMMLAIGAALALAGPSPQLSVSIDVGRDRLGALRPVLVEIRNRGRAPACILRNYNSSLRLAVTRGDKRVKGNFFEGRPSAGCHEVAPGATVRVTYRLDEIVDGGVSGLRVCYSVNWRPGGDTRASLGQRAMACGDTGRDR